MELNSKWKKAIDKAVKENEKVLKSKKEINEEIIEATNVILATSKNDYINIDGIVHLTQKD